MSLKAAPASLRNRVERIETIRVASQPNIVWVEVTDERGLTGLGETYYVPGAVEAVLHDMVAPLVLGADASRIEDIWQTLFARANFHGFAGAEMRAFSALDVALWDLFGQHAGMSIATLLGGRVRDSIRVYNTCVDAGSYDDQTAFVERPGELAQNLLEAGFSAMKIWPWDRFAPHIGGDANVGPAGWSAMGQVGHDLTPEQLQEGLAAVAEIRSAVGGRMDIMIEGHSRWDLNAALAICRTLEPFGVAWIEDAIQPDSPADLARLVRESRVPQCVSERLFSRFAFRNILTEGACHLAMVDVVWSGGVTEARKIAYLADAFHLPIVPHDCTGPVSLAVSLQLCAHATNAKIMEVVRGFVDGWYDEVVEGLPEISGGRAIIPNRPGLGLALRPELRDRDDTVVTTSAR
ncbi:MAG: mandelate racemase/muconate lactonizing enzyme family protein [Actinobacteria bacterium]|nr:mandelate racemase/muconate lactonizing enzyme family protein [Actinomycetota bacterium]